MSEARAARFRRLEPLIDRALELEGDTRERFLALIADIQKHKPSTSKGVFLQRVSVSSTMGPGVGVDRATLGV